MGDWALGTAIWENEPSSKKQHTLDLDASIAASRYLSLDAGFSRETSDRTFRIFEKTEDNTFRVGLDSTGNQYVTLRAKFEHSKRTGSGFDEALLEEVGEQPEMRHFDIANRDRDRVTATLNITPTAIFDVNASVSTGKDDYSDSGFGLRDNTNNTWSVGFDVVPTDMVSFGLNYGQEKYKANQYSRTANPLTATDVTFNDPNRDWWLDQDDTVKTFSANLDLLKALPKTDIRIGYDISDGDATYVYGVKSAQTIFPTTALAQLAPLNNKLTDGRVDLKYLRPAEPRARRGVLVRGLQGRGLCPEQHGAQPVESPQREHGGFDRLDLQRIPLPQLHGTHRVAATDVSVVDGHDSR